MESKFNKMFAKAISGYRSSVYDTTFISVSFKISA